MRLKKSILVMTILLSSCAPKHQKPASTWLYGYGQVEKVNGKVKTLTTGKFVHGNMKVDFSYSFDDKGNVIKIENKFNGDSDTTKYSTAYNNNGQKMEAIGLYFDSGKSIKEIYKYDNNGYLVRCIGNANDSSPDTDRFIYDNAGNLVEHQQYFEKKPLWIFKYKYFYNKSAVCTGVEQSMTTWRDSFKIGHKDTTRYISFDSNSNWLKAVDVLNDTSYRKITYY